MADTTKVKEKAKATVTKVADTVPDKVGEVTGKAGGKVREQLTARSTQVADQAGSLGGALRTASEQLRSQDQASVAKITDQAAERIEQAADYLRRSDADTILADVEELGSKQPWVVLAGGVAVGLLASRFLKASSSRRREAVASRALPPISPPVVAPGALPPDESPTESGTLVVPILPGDSRTPISASGGKGPA